MVSLILSSLFRVAWENVEKQERVREEGIFQDKEKFITESYARQLELNKKEEMIVEMEEKLNQSRVLNNTGVPSKNCPPPPPERGCFFF